MNIPDDLRYAESHEWIKPPSEDGGRCPVGISDHAQSELGEVVYVDLPDLGADVKAGETIAVVESVKAASDIYAPVSGTITDVNEALEDAPESINQEPYGKGWIFKIEPSGDAGFDQLLDADGYRSSIS